MFERYKNFIHGVSGNAAGLWGVVLTTTSFVGFILFEVARLSGILTNTYVGLVTYMLFPALFIIGLLLILIGWRRLKKQSGRTTAELMKQRFGDNQTKAALFGSKVFTTIIILTLVNILFIVAAGSRMMAFMDEPVFCGTACHSVMNPEWVTYQASPHSRVKCVECHVGEGADALFDSKLNGLWQMVSVTFDLLERPIPTPVHQLRPARETCEKCHWPDKFYGSRLKRIERFKKDEASSVMFTTLNLKVNGGSLSQKGGIHWHVAGENEVRYASVDDKRNEMIWVDVRQDDGSFRRYTNKTISDAESNHEDSRILDCVDCHNRATHIYENPGYAVDERISRGILNRSLPYLKREGLKAVSADYPDKESAMRGIDNQLRGFYRNNYPDISRKQGDIIDSAVLVFQSIYSRNIHPEMNIEWGTYASLIGHIGDGGCFRCHNSNLVDDAGNTISDDCTLCHSILAYGSESSFKFIQPADSTDPNFEMHKYLRDEFIKSAGL